MLQLAGEAKTTQEQIETSQAGQADEPAVPPIMIAEDIYEIVSKMTDIPLSKVSYQVEQVAWLTSTDPSFEPHSLQIRKPAKNPPTLILKRHYVIIWPLHCPANR